MLRILDSIENYSPEDPSRERSSKVFSLIKGTNFQCEWEFIIGGMYLAGWYCAAAFRMGTAEKC